MNRTPTRISTRHCFNTGIFQDILIGSVVTSIEIQLTALEKHSSLNDIQLFIGQDNVVFEGQNLVQDSSRTWLVPDERDPQVFEFDFLEISSSAHLGLQSSSTFDGSLTVGQLSGDHTGTLHVGVKQNVALTASSSTVLPFNVQTYRVC